MRRAVGGRRGGRMPLRARYRASAMSAKRLTPSPMVHLRTVPSEAHARLIAARLGSEGILTQLRGGVGGPYPFGEVSIWVGGDDAPSASELLLADEVEAALEPAGEDPSPAPQPRALRWRLLAAAGLVAMAGAAVGSRLLP